MEKTQIKDFTKGNITKQLVSFAWPLFLANLLQVVYNMVDMVVVGQTLGKTGTSAVSVGGDVAHLLTFVAMGFSSAGQVIIAKYIGAGKREKIGRFIGTMSAFLFYAAAIISVMAIVFRHQLLSLMNTPREAYSGALEYSVISMAGLVFIYGYNAVSAILRGMGDSKHPFIFIAIAALLNVVLDIVFVIGFGMGSGGAAFATVTSQAVSFICCVVFLVRKRSEFSLAVKLRDFIVPDREMLSDLVKLGTPMAIKTAAIQFSKLFVNSWINGYGVAVSAFAGIANKVSNIANLISAAMNVAGSTMVGQNIAAKEYGRVKKILLNIAAISLGVAAVFSALISIFPNQIFAFFTSEGDSDVLALTSGYIPIAILLFLASAMRSIMNALLNGSGNYKINFVTAILDGIVMRIGLSLLFGLALKFEYYGFWLGDAIAGFTPFFIGVVFYFSGVWRKEKNTQSGT